METLTIDDLPEIEINIPSTSRSKPEPDIQLRLQHGRNSTNPLRLSGCDGAEPLPVITRQNSYPNSTPNSRGLKCQARLPKFSNMSASSLVKFVPYSDMVIWPISSPARKSTLL